MLMLGRHTDKETEEKDGDLAARAERLPPSQTIKFNPSGQHGGWRECTVARLLFAL